MGLGLIGLGGLLLIITSVAWTARPADRRAWRQGPALPLPHASARVEGLQLQIVEQQPTLTVALMCTKSGVYPHVAITVEDDGASSVYKLDGVTCSTASGGEQARMTTALPIEVGRALQLSLEAAPAGGERSGKQTALKVRGTDGLLRAGAGSVWR